MQMDKSAKQNARTPRDIIISILLTPEVGVLIPIIVLCVITTSIKPNFLTWKYFASILKGCIFIGAAALGQSFAAIAGEIDEFTQKLWESLYKANRISLYVRFTDLETGAYQENIVNQYH